jgi:hypothetical protein
LPAGERKNGVIFLLLDTWMLGDKPVLRNRLHRNQFRQVNVAGGQNGAVLTDPSRPSDLKKNSATQLEICLKYKQQK